MVFRRLTVWETISRRTNFLENRLICARSLEKAGKLGAIFSRGCPRWPPFVRLRIETVSFLSDLVPVGRCCAMRKEGLRGSMAG